jgi:hypothetical protein
MEQYFANLPVEELIPELNHRVESYFSWILNSGRLAKWRIAYNAYHGQRGSHSSSWVNSGGEQGELSFLMSNEYRNLVQHLVVVATQQRPATECIAANSDLISQSQAILGDSLIESYFKEKKVEKVMKQSLEAALAAFDVCWTFPFWDPTRGETAMVNPESGQPIPEGDIRAFFKTPLEVIVDYTNKDADRDDWIIIKDQRNKYDLAATFPEKAEAIIGLTREKTQDALFDFSDIDWHGSMQSDEVDIYTFMHEKTPSVPEGRMTTFFKSAGSLYTFDGPLPYKEIPKVRVCPTEQLLSKFGYSNTNDLLALQDVVDGLISATVTNITSLGVNNIWSQKGDSIDYDQLAKGLSLIQSDTKPEPLILNEVNPQVLPIMNFMIERMQTLSGVNAVARGNLQREMSGSAMALVQSMAIQFNSGVQAAMTHQIEEVGTLIIRHLQNFAQTERLAVIAGKSRNYMSKYFTGKDIGRIDRVIVRQGNAYADTVAGKVDIADKLLSANMIKNPDEYLQVLQTGRLEPAIEGEQNELMTIRAENEAMADGQNVQAIWLDMHPRHIQGHKYMLSNPETRQDPVLVQRVTQHIQEHVMLMKFSDPVVLQILGIPAVPPGPEFQNPLPQGPAMQLTNDMSAPNIPANAGAAIEVRDPTQEGIQGVRQPNMPKNALSGERFDPSTGGLPEVG